MEIHIGDQVVGKVKAYLANDLKQNATVVKKGLPLSSSGEYWAIPERGTQLITPLYNKGEDILQNE